MRCYKKNWIDSIFIQGRSLVQNESTLNLLLNLLPIWSKIGESVAESVAGAIIRQTCANWQFNRFVVIHWPSTRTNKLQWGLSSYFSVLWACTKLRKLPFPSLVWSKMAINGQKTSGFEILMLVSFYCGLRRNYCKKNRVDNLYPGGCGLVQNFAIGAKMTFFWAILTRRPNFYGIEPK